MPRVCEWWLGIVLPYDGGVSVISCLLGDVTSGFYIDVGAADPDVASITKPFYDEGWHGINIEPVPRQYQRLQKKRLRDINLPFAIGSHAGTVTLYEMSDGMALSTVNKHLANEYIKEGHRVQPYQVQCRTLEEICANYGVGTVHFLKIDVEGNQKSVLEGFAFAKVRPWLIIVEAIDPITTHDTSNQWESLIVNRRYELVYYDGLNRFYLAQERLHMRKRLLIPPWIR
jgi:FkbM family methyltransferase